MPESQVFGWECKLYVDDSASYVGTPETPTWDELDSVMNAQLVIGFEELDASVRAGGGTKSSEPGLLTVSINGTIESNNGNTEFEALRTAFLTRAALNIMALSGGSNNADAKGVKGDFKFFKFDRKEDLNGKVTVDFELKPCRSLRANFVQAATGTGS
jgi:hypothetical protein